MFSRREEFHKWLESAFSSVKYPFIVKACDQIDEYSKTNNKLGFSIFETDDMSKLDSVFRFLKKDVFFRAKHSRYIYKIMEADAIYNRYVFGLNYKKPSETESNQVNEVDPCELNHNQMNQVSANEPTSKLENFSDNELKMFKKLLTEKYQKGFRLNDSLSSAKFRKNWKEMFSSTLQLEDEEICRRIKNITIEYSNVSYLPENMLDEKTANKISSYISKCFDNGNNVIFYEGLYESFEEDFLNSRINNAGMLRAYLEYLYKGKYYFEKRYFSSDSDIEVDVEEDIKSFLIAQNCPIFMNEIFECLPHIPEKKVYNVLTGPNSYEFIRNQKSQYFHADIINFSDEEIEQINKWIELSINDKGYMGGKNLLELIKAKFPSIKERYPFLEDLGLREVLAYKLRDRFSFESAIISHRGEGLKPRDIYATFAHRHDYFTLSQLNDIKNELGLPIYYEQVYDNSIRINKDEFISKEKVEFDVEKIDSAIDNFCQGEYVLFKEINNFGGFPYIGYPWNHFLLESYIVNYSEEYILLHAGFGAAKVAGAIVKNTSKFYEFNDILVDSLSKSYLELDDINEALQYLMEEGLLIRRSCSEIDDIMNKAKMQRN